MQDAQYRIKELIQMKDSGEINQSEFDQLKASALSGQQGEEPTAKKPISEGTGLDLEVGVELQCGSNESYRLIKKIGNGGMGEVWQVEDLNESAAFKETVYKAIKVLPLDLAQSSTHLELLRKEAALTARLSHDNIINVFGLREGQAKANQRQGKIPFLLMEYLQGEDLEHYLETREPLNWAQAEPWLSNIASALDNAWRTQQLIHRDLKPGNIFLTDSQQLKLLDFGLAWRIRKSQLSLSNQEVDDSSSRGTVAYMPPEAFANTAPDPRQDVYALACVCYQMLTGETPYPPEAARQRDSKLYPDAPKQLNEKAWDTLKQGFSYNKEQRPKSAGELMEKLKAAQNKQEKSEAIKRSKHNAEPTTLPHSKNADKPRVKRNYWMIVLIVCLFTGLIYEVQLQNKIERSTEISRKVKKGVAEKLASEAKQSSEKSAEVKSKKNNFKYPDNLFFDNSMLKPFVVGKYIGVCDFSPPLYAEKFKNKHEALWCVLYINESNAIFYHTNVVKDTIVKGVKLNIYRDGVVFDKVNSFLRFQNMSENKRIKMVEVKNIQAAPLKNSKLLFGMPESEVDFYQRKRVLREINFGGELSNIYYIDGRPVICDLSPTLYASKGSKTHNSLWCIQKYDDGSVIAYEKEVLKGKSLAGVKLKIYRDGVIFDKPNSHLRFQNMSEAKRLDISKKMQKFTPKIITPSERAARLRRVLKEWDEREFR